jgi:hypothetical protein
MIKNLKPLILRCGTSLRFQLALLFIVWLVSVASRVIVNGVSFGFDYSIYQPDGVLYALRTYMFLGERILVLHPCVFGKAFRPSLYFAPKHTRLGPCCAKNSVPAPINPVCRIIWNGWLASYS